MSPSPPSRSSSSSSRWIRRTRRTTTRWRSCTKTLVTSTRPKRSCCKARDVKPDDPDVYAQLAGFYERAWPVRQADGGADRPAPTKNPDNPEAQHHDWRHLLEQGLPAAHGRSARKARRRRTPSRPSTCRPACEAENKAISLRDDYIDALVFKDLLLRSQAFLEKSAQRQKEPLMTRRMRCSRRSARFGSASRVSPRRPRRPNRRSRYDRSRIARRPSLLRSEAGLLTVLPRRTKARRLPQHLRRRPVSASGSASRSAHQTHAR